MPNNIVIKPGVGNPVQIRTGIGSLISIGPAPAAPAENIVTDQLLMHLDAANASSYSGAGSTWYDLSGNGYNGTLINSPTFQSAVTKSFAFNGSTQNVEVSSLDLRRDFSIEMWFKVNSFNPVWTSLLGQGISDTSKSIFIAHFTGGTAIMYRMYNNDFDKDFSPATPTNTWTQYVFTYSHSSPYTKKIYRNGQLQFTSGPQGQYAGTGTFYIATDYGRGSFLNGNISIVRVYSKVVSDADVLQNYNAQKARYGL